MQTVSLVPLALLAWYPALFGGIPLVPLGLMVTGIVFLLRARLRVPEDLRWVYGSIALFSVLTVLTFGYQMFQGIHVNASTEIYIFGVNAVVGPLIFLMITGMPHVSGQWLVWGASLATCLVLGLAIALQSSWNILGFDSQGRLFLPLTLNSMPATSLSLVVSLLFAGNLTILRSAVSRFDRWLTVALLLVLTALIYLFASRFAILIIIASTGWYVLWRAYRGAPAPLVFSAMAAVGIGLLVRFGPLSANARFLESWASFALIGNPLADTSLAVRVFLWYSAMQEIAGHPFGIGYMTFVSRTVVADPVVAWRGLNAHNEFLLQTMALGWLPAAVLGACAVFLIRSIRRRGELGRMMPILIAVVIAGMFETFSNNPNSINVIPMIWMMLGATLIVRPNHVPTAQRGTAQLVSASPS